MGADIVTRVNTPGQVGQHYLIITYLDHGRREPRSEARKKVGCRIQEEEYRAEEAA